jgi:hypothetical protein
MALPLSFEAVEGRLALLVPEEGTGQAAGAAAAATAR